MLENHNAYYYSKVLERFYSKTIYLCLFKPLFPKFI